MLYTGMLQKFAKKWYHFQYKYWFKSGSCFKNCLKLNRPKAYKKFLYWRNMLKKLGSFGRGFFFVFVFVFFQFFPLKIYVFEHVEILSLLSLKVPTIKNSISVTQLNHYPFVLNFQKSTAILLQVLFYFVCVCLFFHAILFLKSRVRPVFRVGHSGYANVVFLSLVSTISNKNFLNLLKSATILK